MTEESLDELLIELDQIRKRYTKLRIERDSLEEKLAEVTLILENSGCECETWGGCGRCLALAKIKGDKR